MTKCHVLTLVVLVLNVSVPVSRIDWDSPILIAIPVEVVGDVLSIKAILVVNTRFLLRSPSASDALTWIDCAPQPMLVPKLTRREIGTGKIESIDFSTISEAANAGEPDRIMAKKRGSSRDFIV